MFLIIKSQEYGRQKLRATKLGAVYLKKVEDDAQEITEGTSHIYSWIRNQALSKTLTIVIFHVNHIIIKISPIVIRHSTKQPNLSHHLGSTFSTAHQVQGPFLQIFSIF